MISNAPMQPALISLWLIGAQEVFKEFLRNISSQTARNSLRYWRLINADFSLFCVAKRYQTVCKY